MSTSLRCASAASMQALSSNSLQAASTPGLAVPMANPLFTAVRGAQAADNVGDMGAVGQLSGHDRDSYLLASLTVEAPYTMTHGLASDKQLVVLNPLLKLRQANSEA
jgi:hypothetical protein